MTLALRITSSTAPPERRERFITVDNIAEAWVWMGTRPESWAAITGGTRRLAVVASRIGGQP